MKTRESGMPEEEYWASFFKPAEILKKLGLDSSYKKVVDIGCGYGTFTIPAAHFISGLVIAIDIDHQMVERCQRKVDESGLLNIAVQQRDFIADGTGLADNLIDFVMLFNILHAEDPISILQETWRILRPGGKVGIIHWNHDASTPRGPSMVIRPKPEQIYEWLQKADFTLYERLIDLPPYHYGIVGQKLEFHSVIMGSPSI